MKLTKSLNNYHQSAFDRRIERIDEFMYENDLSSIHTGETIGFSRCYCELCGTTVSGERFEATGIQFIDGVNRPFEIGDICTDCFDVVN